MPSQREPQGCRNTAVATAFLVGLALVFMATGLGLVNQGSCEGGCETLALTLLYGGLPISAIFGVAFGELVVAWPLDITFWVVIGFFLARHAGSRRRRVAGPVMLAVVLALIYGLVLSFLVEIVI